MHQNIRRPPQQRKPRLRQATKKTKLVRKQKVQPSLKNRKRSQVRHAAPKKANRKANAKKVTSALKHSQAKLQAHQQRRVKSLMQKKLGQEAGNATAGPANPVPAEGQEIDLQNGDKFVEGFEISFKVKFNNFNRNEQALVTTDEHTLLIQGLGPRYVGDAGKISAWVKVDSGLGPHNRGLRGSDGSGQLLSQVVSTNTWHDVKLKKDATTLNLIVDGTPCHLCPVAIDRNVIIHLPDFDMMRGSTKLRAGKKAGSGDIALDGDMGDVAVVEGRGHESVA